MIERYECDDRRFSVRALPARWPPNRLRATCSIRATGRSPSSTPRREHHYQPGYLFIPFGTYQPDDVVKPDRSAAPDGIDFVSSATSKSSDSDEHTVALADGRVLPYDQLVIATGTHPRRDQTEGLDSDEYGVDGARLLHPGRCDALAAEARRLARRPTRHEHHRDADQVPGGAARVHVPRRRVLHREGNARQGRTRLRHAARRRVHQAGRSGALGTMLDNAQHRAGERLHDDGGRHRTQHVGELRRTRRSPTTCSSPCRSTWVRTSSNAPGSATN